MATIKSIEEKAKRYDEAVKKLRVLRDDWATTQNRAAKEIEEIFPELKESEDERIRKYLKRIIGEWSYDDLYAKGFRKEDMIAWLNKQGEQKPAWSEQDRKMLDVIIECIKYLKSREERDKEAGIKLTFIETYTCIISWLKSLKDRVQPKQEWSEEDATHYNRILKELNLQKEMPINASVFEEIKSDIIWLESLRERYTWKPRDNQIRALKEVCNEHWDSDGLDPLYTLYQDLKKLMEE